MPKLAKPLTDLQVRTAKPIEGKAHTLADGMGMYLEIAASGTRIWRMSYRQENGKQNRLTTIIMTCNVSQHTQLLRRQNAVRNGYRIKNIDNTTLS